MAAVQHRLAASRSLTTPRDLAGLLQFLRIRRAHVVGHSYGGLVGLQLALDRPDVAGSLVLMEPALRTAALRANVAGPAVEDLHRRMSAGFQRYRDGDREGAVEGFLGATFGPGYRQQLEQVLPGWWDQAVQIADAFFGAELPELQSWEFGPSQARRITIPILGARQLQRFRIRGVRATSARVISPA
jgi:pimeloyl-ACP methyl ester carboxylesterase